VLLGAFFYDSFTKLGGHLLELTAVQIQFPGDLFIGQVQSHKIEAQYPHLEELMMPGEDRARQIIEAFLTILTLITLSGRLFVIETSSDDSLGITTRTLSAYWPTQLAHCIVMLDIVYQDFYVYLQLLSFVYGLEKVGLSFTTLRSWNPT